MSDFQGLPKTTNLNLNKPGYDNVADIMALNENADIIDAAIKTNIDDIANIKKGYVKTVNGVGVDSKGNVNVEEYTHPNSGVTAGTYRSVTVNAQGHVTAGSNPTLAIADGGTGAIDATTACSNLGAIGYKTNIGSIKSIAGCFWADDASGISEDELPKEIGEDDFVLLQIGGKRGQDKYQFLFDASLGIYCRQDDFTLGNEEWSVNDWDRFAYPSEIRGMIFPFAGNSTIPTGFLPCNGSAVSRTTYAKLFAVIGTTYGAGNGSTTFNLPNLTDKFIQGSNTVGAVKKAGLPNITSRVEFRPMSDNQETCTGPTNGFVTYTHNGGNTWANNISRATGNTFANELFTFDASKGNSIYGNSSTVQPPALTMRYIIKY